MDTMDRECLHCDDFSCTFFGQISVIISVMLSL